MITAKVWSILVCGLANLFRLPPRPLHIRSRHHQILCLLPSTRRRILIACPIKQLDVIIGQKRACRGTAGRQATQRTPASHVCPCSMIAHCEIDNEYPPTELVGWSTERGERRGKQGNAAGDVFFDISQICNRPRRRGGGWG